jgi:D-glycero-D-manno-heptose 1,7-bisphosphate phosphatase
MLGDRTAVFLDRDGTVIVDKHYLKEPTEVELLAGAREAMENFRKINCLLFLFSNQSGVSRGFLTLEDVELCNSRMLELLGCRNDVFAEICVAPEMPNDMSGYRKPSPRFILEMMKKYDLSAKKSYMVGDGENDVLSGLNAGINSILISPGSHKIPGAQRFRNTMIFRSILDFSLWLMSNGCT